MKKYLTLAIALTMVCACEKKIVELAPVQEENGETLFTGGFSETKISLGDKVGSTWETLWEEGATLTVKSGGSTLGTATLVSGAGSRAARG